MYIAASILAFLVLTLVAVALHTAPVRRNVRWMDTPLHDHVTITTTYSSELAPAADTWTLTGPPTTAVSRQVLRAARRRWFFGRTRRHWPGMLRREARYTARMRQ